MNTTRNAVVATLLAGAFFAAATPAHAQQEATDNKSAPARRLTRAPSLVTFVEAEYPPEEKAQGRTGTVVLQVAISATGKVEQVSVVESAGLSFDQAAMAAVRRFVFTPAEFDGKPAPVKITYRYEFTLKPEAKTTADFRGRVIDRTTGKGIPGVTIRLDSGVKALSDADGAFVITDISPGKHGVLLSGNAFTGIGTEEVFEAGREIDVAYKVDIKPPDKTEDGDEDDFEMVVVAPKLDKRVVSTEVSAEQSRKVPGTQGDVLKVVENLPGVGRSAVGSGQLVVWGAAPQDTRVYVDGVRIPVLYHEGGMRSVIHPDLVGSVELAPGGYGSPYGRGLGGLVLSQMRPLNTNGFHGSASADIIDVAGSARTNVGDRFRIAIAARRSHLDSLLSAVTSEDVKDFVPIPSYYDGQARASYAISPKEFVEAGALVSHDTITRSLLDADPAESKREFKKSGFWRGYIRYNKDLSNESSVGIVTSYGRDKSHVINRFGTTPALLEVDSDVFGFRAFWKGRANRYLNVMIGLDAEIESSSVRRSGSLTSPPREGDIRVFGQPPSDQINADDWKATIGSIAPFAEADISLFKDSLHILPGARLEPSIIGGSRITPAQGDTPALSYMRQETAVEPRLSVRYIASDALTIKAAYGQYHQGPRPEDLSAVFGNPTLGMSKATHWLVGSSMRLSQTVGLEVTAFLSESENLSVRNPTSSPRLAQALIQGGRGRAFGTQFLMRKELSSGLFGWISYSIIRSERAQSPDGPFRLFDYDQSHVLTALLAYDLGRGFEVGGRFRYATGFPRTPVLGTYYDGRRDLYQPIFGAHNSIRIPAFYQADVRFAKRIKMGTSELELYLDLQNVSNRKNPEEIAYNRNYSQRKYITGLPILPVFGAKWSW